MKEPQHIHLKTWHVVAIVLAILFAFICLAAYFSYRLTQYQNRLDSMQHTSVQFKLPPADLAQIAQLVTVRDGVNGRDGRDGTNGLDGHNATSTQTILKEQLPPEKGEPGPSAYDLAVKNGFDGTEREWLLSLRGKDGEEAASPRVPEFWFDTGVDKWKWRLVGDTIWNLAEVQP